MLGYLDVSEWPHLHKCSPWGSELHLLISSRVYFSRLEGQELTAHTYETMDRQPCVISLIFFVSFFVLWDFFVKLLFSLLFLYILTSRGFNPSCFIKKQQFCGVVGKWILFITQSIFILIFVHWLKKFFWHLEQFLF